MALIECPDCARQVSDQAEACPSCGHPFSQISSEDNLYPVSDESASVEKTRSKNSRNLLKMFPSPMVLLYGVALVFLFLFLALSFHVVSYSGGIQIIPKEHLTFADTFVDLQDLIQRYNKATWWERLRGEGVNGYLINKLKENKLLVINEPASRESPLPQQQESTGTRERILPDVNEIGAGKWVVKVGCLGFAEGSERCKIEEQYRWLKSLRDNHPKFIAYHEYQQNNLIFYQIVDQLRPDVFSYFTAAFVGPFESENKGREWIGWAVSQASPPEGYDFWPWQIVQYIGHVEPEQKLVSAVKKVRGTITESVNLRRESFFTLATDVGEQMSFSAGLYDHWFGKAPLPEEKGKRYSVEFREVTYKRAGKVIKTELDLVTMQRMSE